MNRCRRLVRPALWALAGLALALVVTALLPGGVLVHATPVKGGPPLWAAILQPGETFTIRYYHSVENAPIWETHSVDKEGRIYIEEERYLKFGAGMGKMPGVGHMVMEGPYEAIVDMHMPVGNFILRVGSPGVDHTIIRNGRETNLSALVPHKAVRFSAEPLSLIQRWWWRLAHGQGGLQESRAWTARTNQPARTPR